MTDRFAVRFEGTASNRCHTPSGGAARLALPSLSPRQSWPRGGTWDRRAGIADATSSHLTRSPAIWYKATESYNAAVLRIWYGRGSSLALMRQGRVIDFYLMPSY